MGLQSTPQFNSHTLSSVPAWCQQGSSASSASSPPQGERVVFVLFILGQPSSVLRVWMREAAFSAVLFITSMEPIQFTSCNAVVASHVLGSPSRWPTLPCSLLSTHTKHLQHRLSHTLFQATADLWNPSMPQQHPGFSHSRLVTILLFPQQGGGMSAAFTALDSRLKEAMVDS